MKNINPNAYNWLVSIPTKSWCKHAFNIHPRCDVLMNNLYESFNSTILLARDKPNISMMEWIRSYIMSRFATLRDKLNAYPRNIMPRTQKRLDRKVEKSGNWLPVWVGDAKFEVTQGFTMEKFLVDLSKHSCNCYFWNLVGIPCSHVVTTINYKIENPEAYVHAYYKRDVYQACYGPEITPINGQQLWPKSNQTELLPLFTKPHLGNQKKQRRREPNEHVNHSKLSKKNVMGKCSRCNQYGHNIRSCRKGMRRKGNLHLYFFSINVFVQTQI